MKIVSDKSCREKQNTHFVLVFIFRKRLLCIRKSGKMW